MNVENDFDSQLRIMAGLSEATHPSALSHDPCHPDASDAKDTWRSNVSFKLE